MSLLVLPHWRIRLQLIQTWFRYKLARRNRPIDQIRASWAQEGSKDPWLSTKLFDLTRNTAVDSLDDRTWMDLEFGRLRSAGLVLLMILLPCGSREWAPTHQFLSRHG